MTKSIIKLSFIFLVLACTGIFNGCDKAKLDLLPHGPTEQSYFSSESEFNKGVLGIYSKLTDFFWFNGGPGNTTVTVFLLPGDDITTNQGGEEFEIFSMQPSSGRLGYLYSRHYQMINRANLLIQKIDEEQGKVYTTAGLKNAHKGEALFLRGYAYYNLWNLFGTSPLVIERQSGTDQFLPPGTTGTQLLDQAIKDLSEAATLLPATWDAANRGRVTASSANGMLGKSLVFRASAAKTQADYTAALTAFNKITGASLIPNFSENFSYLTENNAESLFEFQSGQAFGGDNVWLDNDFDNAIGSLSFYWGFYSNNGTGQQGQSRFFATTKLLNAYNAADPRRDSTLNPANRTIRKYVTVDKLNQAGVSSINNYRILRFADVLLLKAEATIQSGGSVVEAIGFINQVRARARGAVAEPANFSLAETNRQTIMQWIMDERLRELAGEGQRWFDLRRWQMQGIISLNNAFFSSNLSTVSFQLPRHLNFPIPSSETDVNPNVPQNTGY
ncbi:MAG: RagB/SusD family nutrient uptake outer membrane protein [Chitinophagaceae bacterium]|nr:MAG: RagB/SusD family nutrient uptake outer membrane protein [Chitinophagaceae bacterium]